MKEIPNTLERGGFTYSLVKRDGDAALFTKVFSNKPDGPKWFEVIKLILDDDGNETFPAPSSWGILAHTFSASKEEEAEAKYQDFVNEFGSQPHHAPTVVVDPDSTPPHQHVAHILPVNPPPIPKVPAATKDTKTRGRKKLDVELKIPEIGTFQARELADESGMSVPFVHNRLNNLVKDGVIEIYDKVQGKRGKPIILFKKKGAAV